MRSTDGEGAWPAVERVLLEDGRECALWLRDRLGEGHEIVLRRAEMAVVVSLGGRELGRVDLVYRTWTVDGVTVDCALGHDWMLDGADRVAEALGAAKRGAA